ncbi:hypothetical protein I656_02892 [Geobacillus sp. WSUCF1]|nr:hypothetical protein I656_02892 [Geobacillus sp. WSUCF1]
MENLKYSFDILVEKTNGHHVFCKRLTSMFPHDRRTIDAAPLCLFPITT